MRYSAGARSAGAGSTTLPLASLYGAAAAGGRLREVGVFNTTVTALAVMLTRLSTAGMQGAGLTEAKHDDDDGPAAQCTGFNTHTAAPALGDDLGYRAALGAAIGAGVIWTFGDKGLRIKPGTANGIGILIATGTGQICDVYFVWEE